MLANMARLANDMSEAKSTVERSMKGIESAVATAKAALAGLGIGLSIGYFVSLVKGTIDAMDHLHDLSKTTRITVEDLAGLSLAAKQSGGDLDSIAASVDKLSVNMGKNPEKFKALGISAKDPLEAFKQLADIFNLLEDTQQRNAVAAAALGKSWAGAAPLLAQGSQRIAEMVENGRRLSGITEENTAQAKRYHDQMAELSAILGSSRNRLVGEWLPTMNEIARAMSEAAKEGGLLLAVWVGLGSAWSTLLGLGEAASTAKRLKEVNEQLEIANKQLQAGSLNPSGANSSFWSFLIPDVKLKDEALAKLRETIMALQAERDRLMPPKPKPKLVQDGMDDAAIDAIIAGERAKQFLKATKDDYAARIAVIKIGGQEYAQGIKTANTLAELAIKEGGINNQRTREELMNQEQANNVLRIKREISDQEAIRAAAMAKSGPAPSADDTAASTEFATLTAKKMEDAAKATAEIKKLNAELADSEAIAQAKIRASRTETAQQQLDQYNSVNAAHEQAGSAIADSLRSSSEDQTKRENDDYDIRLANLGAYLSSAQGQIADEAQLREGLEIQHQQNLLQIENNKHQAERSMQVGTWQLAAELMQSLAGKSKLAAIAAIAISKGLAIAQVIQQTAIASMAAFAPPPIGLGPLGGAGLAASIQSLGAIQIGLIAATGLVQASQVGGGGASVGSPSNPVNVTGGGSSSSQNMPMDNAPPPPQTVINVSIVTNGNVIGDDGIKRLVDENVIPALQDAIGNQDVIIIGPNSRQAAALGK